MSSVKDTVTYTYQEVFEASVKYFNGDKMSAGSFADKYALNDSGKWYEKTPDDMFRNRIVPEFVRMENKYINPLSFDDIFSQVDHFSKVVPQGSPLYGIGNFLKLISIGNCYVVSPPKDSWGSIMKSDQELAQIMKRRGGCLKEGTPVLTKSGLVDIENVKAGMEVLSYNIETCKNEWKEVLDAWETDVKLEDQFVLTFDNGTKLPTSKKHPVLSIDSKLDYKYIEAGLFNGSLCGVKPTGYNNDIYNFDRSLLNFGWMLGAHTGDGTFGKTKNGYRERILAMSEDVVKRFAEEINNTVGSNVKYGISSRKEYKSIVCEFVQRSKNTKKLKKLFDNYVGSKTYTCKVFSKVIKKNLWIPYFAGLMDTDGWVTDTGNMAVDLCAKDVIYIIGGVLASCGIDYRIYEKTSVRKNEKIIYRLRIPYNEKFYNTIKEIMADKEKANKLTSRKTFGGAIEIDDSIFNSFYGKYLESKHVRGKGTLKENTNVSKIIPYLKKKKKIGMNAVEVLKRYNFITENEYIRMSSRVKLKKSQEDILVKNRYFEISVKDNNNYFAGSGGLVNIHNCGIDISSIRPRGFSVNNAAKTTDGIEVFMDQYSDTTKRVAQAGGRRGALMVSILCTHIQILDFIKIKRNKNRVTGANISVKFTEDFFDCLRNKKKFILRHPATSSVEEAEKTVEIDPQLIWNEFIESNHMSAEPGALFWDNLINNSISDCYADVGFATKSTNPCGELPLPAYGSCILLLINLLSYVKNKFTKDAYFDFDEFKESIRIATRMGDDMVDIEIEKIKKLIEKVVSDPEDDDEKQIELNLWNNVLKALENGRRDGLGITALADMLAALNIKYDSDEALAKCEEIFKFFHENNFYYDSVLAKERGAFKCWDWEKEKNNIHIKMLPQEIQDHIKQYGRRNISSTTIAPAGTISIETQTSSGCEPVFEAKYTRRKKISPEDEKNGVKAESVDQDGTKWTSYQVVHRGVEQFIETTGKTYEESPYYKADAKNIDWGFRIKLQSTIQKYITHSISSCVSKDSLIDTDLGLMYIDELTDFNLIKNDSFIKNNTFNGNVLNHNQERVKIDEFYNNGVKDTYKISLNNGLNLICTSNEKLYVYDEDSENFIWKEIVDIKEGDIIKTKKYNA